MRMSQPVALSFHAHFISRHAVSLSQVADRVRGAGGTAAVRRAQAGGRAGTAQWRSVPAPGCQGQATGGEWITVDLGGITVDRIR